MKLKATIASQSGIMILEAFSLAVLSFGTFFILTRSVSLEIVGVWALVNSVLNYARAADFWSRGMLSFVGEARGAGDEKNAVTYISTTALSGFAGYFCLASLAGGTIWLLADSIVGPEMADQVRLIIPIMMATFWAMSLGGVYQNAFVAFGRPLFKFIQSVGGALIFLIGAFFLAPRFGLQGILFAQLSQAIFALLFSLVAFYGVTTRRIVAPYWDSAKGRQLLGFGIRAMAVSSVQLAIEPIIRIMASRFGGLETVAVVELASRLVLAVRNLIVAVNPIMVSVFSHHGTPKAGRQARRTYVAMSRLIPMMALPVFGLLFAVAPAFERIMLAVSGTPFLFLLLALSAAWGVNLIALPAYSLLTGRRRLRPLFIIHVILAAGSLGFGVLGGIIAGLVGAFCGIVCAFILASFYSFYVAYAVVGFRSMRSGLPSILPRHAIPLLVGLVILMAVELFKIGGASELYMLSLAGLFVVGLACMRFSDLGEAMVRLRALRVQ